MAKADLRIDWATHAAAKYACENWHYSRCTPKFKQIWVGVWERGRFIGIISFGRSSTPYLGDAFDLKTTECVELTRVALKSHENAVSRIMAISLKFLKRQSPGIKMVVSLADPSQNHHGGIYQATNWIYVGRSSKMTQYYFRGKWRNDTSLKRYLQKNPSAKDELQKRKILGKHKYLMPLDADMREQIAPLSKPYPKRVKQAMTGDHPEQRRGSTDLHAPFNEAL